MVYPYSPPADNKADSTPTAADHPAHHNALADALIALLAELGSGPKGGSADLTTRLATLDAAVALLAPLASPTFTGTLVTPSAKISGKNGLSPRTSTGRSTTTGAPTTGTWAVDDVVRDSAGVDWRCTVAGTPGTWVTDSGSYVGPSPRLYQPTHLRRWAAKRDNALTQVAYIGVPGDSIGAGAYGSTVHDSSAASHNQWRDWGWVGILRALFARDYGAAGLGSVAFLPDDSSWSITAGAPVASSTVGPMQTGYRLSAGDAITRFTPRCTTVEAHYWEGGSGAFTMSVDGETAVAAAAPSGLDAFNRLVISGLADTIHTVVINGPASGQAFIGQHFLRGPSATGIIVSNMSKSGATTDTLVRGTAGVPDSTANQTRMFKAMFARPGSVTDLAIIPLGYNDGALQGTNGITPSIYRASLKMATDFINAQGGCTLLVGEPRASNESSPFTQQNYYDQAHDLANTDDHVAFLDIGDLFGTYAQANAVGYQWGSGVDVIHPSIQGHGAMGHALYRALTDAGVTNA